MIMTLAPDRTDESRPPVTSVGRFAAQNAAWGGLLGLVISIAWLVVTQNSWFAIQVCLAGAALSASYGAIASVPALLAARRAPRARVLVGCAVFATTVIVVQSAMLIAFSAWPLVWNAAAYVLLGTFVVGVTLRAVLSRPEAGRSPRRRRPQKDPSARSRRRGPGGALAAR